MGRGKTVMGELVHMQTGQGGIARIVLDQPPINALGGALRHALSQALDKVVADPGLNAIVIAAAGPNFSAGAEIPESEGGETAPALRDLCRRVELCPKPVIAALHGSTLGGGCELAMAAHYRIASEQCSLGLPEVNLGRVPGAGGTQRLPRLVGAEAALEIMLAGRPVPAAEAARLGLVDRVAQGDLAAAAQAYATELIEAGAGPRPTLARRKAFADPIAYQKTVARFRQRVADSPLLAPVRIVDAVEAALLLPVEAALEFEAAARDDCIATPAAKALRHVFLAEGLAGRRPEFAGRNARPLRRVALVADGAVAAGWVVMLLDSGRRVSLHCADAQGVAAQVDRIYATARDGGRIPDALRKDRLARLSVAPPEEALASADLVIARADAAAWQARMQPGAVLALVTEPGRIPDLAGLPHPAEALALMAPGPAHSGRLVEVLTGDATAPEAVMGVVELLWAARKVAVIGPAAEGGIGPAVWGACRWVAADVVRRGTDPATVEAALADHGLKRAVFAGQTPPQPGSGGRATPAGEIVQRAMAAMANTGALLVEAGVAQRPSDIDLVMIHGYGFPAWRGGPMEAADLAGLLSVQNTLKALAEEDASFWAPSALFSDLIKNGRKFADLNRL